MQEEVTRGAVTLIVDGAKLSEQVFEKAVKKFWKKSRKARSRKSTVESRPSNSLPVRTPVLLISRSATRISRLSSRVAKKYHVDFALKKDTAAEQPRYLVFFQKQGRGCHHSGVSGVCQPENEP